MENLDELLRSKLEVAQGGALREDGRVDADQLASLDRLSRLGQIAKSLEASRAKRWPVVAMLLATLAICSLGLFVHVQQTDVAAELTLSSVRFSLPGAHRLTELLQMSAIGISGIQQLEMPALNGQPGRSLNAGDAERPALRVAIHPSAGNSSSITLEPIVAGADVRVEVRALGAPNQLRLTLSRAALVLPVSIAGQVQVAVAGEPHRDVELRAPSSIVVKSDSQPLALDLTLVAPPSDLLVPQIAAQNVLFSRLQPSSDSQSGAVREISTILGGSIYFESIDGRERKLRPGESIQMEEFTGEIRRLGLSDGRLVLSLVGRATGLQSGVGAASRSLMPTYFDWLQARHGLSLMWGAALYAFGLLLTAFRWWGLRI